jgi:DNA-directed RNA polymerase subunit H
MAQSLITQIVKSRKNLLEILQTRDFDISNYANESVSQVQIMYQNDQLDMLMSQNNNESNKDTKKVYVKYYLGKNLRINNIMDVIDDLFTLDNVLNKNDDLIIVTKDPANDSMIKNLKQLWSSDQYYIIIFGIKHLQFNILNHDLVPPHRVLSEEEKNIIKKKYNITDDKQVPDISRFSPVSLAIGIRPGEMCEIIRPSKTAISSTFYRICSV